MALLMEIVQSFYSRRFYYDFAYEHKGLGLRYIAALTVLITIFAPFYLWQTYPAIHPLIEQLPALAKSLPPVTFENGKITTDKAEETNIHLGDAWVTINPHYSIVDTDSVAKVMRQRNMVLLLTQDRLMIMKDAQGNLEMDDLKDWPSFSLTRGDWQKLEDIANGHILFPYLLTLLVVGLFVVLIANLWAIAAIALTLLAISWIIRVRLNAASIIRLASIVRIPIVIVTFAPSLLGTPLGEGMAWFIWLAYLVFVVLACREPIYGKA